MTPWVGNFSRSNRAITDENQLQLCLRSGVCSGPTKLSTRWRGLVLAKTNEILFSSCCSSGEGVSRRSFCGVGLGKSCAVAVLPRHRLAVAGGGGSDSTQDRTSGCSR
eukprot:3052671-Pleurochrysis_carterae.AAC.7